MQCRPAIWLQVLFSVSCVLATSADAQPPVSVDSPLSPTERRFLLDRQLAPAEHRPAVGPGPDQPSPEMLRSIQRSLGGSVVDQYRELRSQPLEHNVPAAPGNAQRSSRFTMRVHALRDAAWQLDMAAHRLELLDLFEQADALREQAARLRLDARRMIDDRGQPPTRPSAAAPTPRPSPDGAAPPLWNDSHHPPAPAPLEDIGPTGPGGAPNAAAPAPSAEATPVPDLAPQPVEPAQDQ